MRTLVNLALFQSTWLASVFGAVHGLSWPGGLALVASVAVQSARRIPVRLPGLGLLASAAVIGFAADSALVMLEWIGFPGHSRSGWPPPAWMSVLWINFATTLDESLAWAGERRVAGAVAGAIGGPLAYLSAQGMGAVRLGPRPGSLPAVAVLWAIACPFLAGLAKSLRGPQAPRASQMPQGGTA